METGAALHRQALGLAEPAGPGLLEHLDGAELVHGADAPDGQPVSRRDLVGALERGAGRGRVTDPLAAPDDFQCLARDLGRRPGQAGCLGAGQGALRQCERAVGLPCVDRAAGRHRVSPAAESRVRRSFRQRARRGDLLFGHRHLVTFGQRAGGPEPHLGLPRGGRADRVEFGDEPLGGLDDLVGVAGLHVDGGQRVVDVGQHPRLGGRRLLEFPPCPWLARRPRWSALPAAGTGGRPPAAAPRPAPAVRPSRAARPPARTAHRAGPGAPPGSPPPQSRRAWPGAGAADPTRWRPWSASAGTGRSPGWGRAARSAAPRRPAAARRVPRPRSRRPWRESASSRTAVPAPRQRPRPRLPCGPSPASRCRTDSAMEVGTPVVTSSFALPALVAEDQLAGGDRGGEHLLDGERQPVAVGEQPLHDLAVHVSPGPGSRRPSA